MISTPSPATISTSPWREFKVRTRFPLSALVSTGRKKKPCTSIVTLTGPPEASRVRAPAWVRERTSSTKALRLGVATSASCGAAWGVPPRTRTVASLAPAATETSAKTPHIWSGNPHDLTTEKVSRITSPADGDSTALTARHRGIATSGGAAGSSTSGAGGSLSAAWAVQIAKRSALAMRRRRGRRATFVIMSSPGSLGGGPQPGNWTLVPYVVSKRNLPVAFPRVLP